MKPFLILSLCLILAACDDFFEEDISRRSVQIVAPADHTRVAPGRIAFRWNALPGAAGYRFVLVAPSFEIPARLVADTLIFADTLSRSYGCAFTLGEGDYAWSVAGFNSAYETLPVVCSLTITAAEE